MFKVGRKGFQKGWANNLLVGTCFNGDASYFFSFFSQLDQIYRALKVQLAMLSSGFGGHMDGFPGRYIVKRAHIHVLMILCIRDESLFSLKKMESFLVKVSAPQKNLCRKKAYKARYFILKYFFTDIYI